MTTTWKQKLMNPLRSRKVRVALATALAAFGAEWGLNIGDEKMYAIISLGFAVIVGIAIEDNGAKGGTSINVSDEKLTAEMTSSIPGKTTTASADGNGQTSH